MNAIAITYAWIRRAETGDPKYVDTRGGKLSIQQF
jgi:hypothetical protein